MASSAALPLHPHLRLQPATVPPGSGGRRPHLRVLDGGRAPGVLARRAVYRRRRLAVAAVLVAALAAVAVLASAALAGLAGGGDPSAAAGGTPSATHVVQPGDTLWSIAAAAAPDADVRVTVEQLRELNGGAQLVPGQVVLVP